MSRKELGNHVFYWATHFYQDFDVSLDNNKNGKQNFQSLPRLRISFVFLINFEMVLLDC